MIRREKFLSRFGGWSRFTLQAAPLHSAGFTLQSGLSNLYSNAKKGKKKASIF
jgi:hypothetical protein